MRLSDTALRGLPDPVGRPVYDRHAVTPGIVHLGLGAFFRAHGAIAIEDCLAAGATDWGIVGASLRAPDVRDALDPQDGLYTLRLRDTEEERLRVVGAVGRVIVAPENPGALLSALADPRIRVVTLTITEKGYVVDPVSGALRADHPDIRQDLANPHRPRTVPGFLVEALRRRREARIAPFTLLSCDNLSGNGATLHRALVGFAEARDHDLARHIAGEVACPSSMVDRIVPATTAADRAAVALALGVEDAWPVVGEPFFQWVVEDRFPTGRPGLEASGVTFVDDVAPYERMKLRLLNGAHTALAAIGRLAGLETVSAAVDEPAVRRFLDLYWQEAASTLPLSTTDAKAYTASLLRRFGNRALPHRTAQIAIDASLKLAPRVVAPLTERLARGAPAPAMTFAVAAFIRSCSGSDDRGRPLPLDDAGLTGWSAPDQKTAAPEAVARAFLSRTATFGRDLPGNAAFIRRLSTSLEAIARDGAMRALDGLVDIDALDGL